MAGMRGLRGRLFFDVRYRLECCGDRGGGIVEDEKEYSKALQHQSGNLSPANTTRHSTEHRTAAVSRRQCGMECSVVRCSAG